MSTNELSGATGISTSHTRNVIISAGRPSERPLPTLFKYTPYLRAYMIRGEQEKSRVAELYRMSAAERAALQDLDLLDPRHLSEWLPALVQQGYAAIVVERPGTGASFGTMDPTLQGTAREADQVLDWIAAQDWCDGRIGMWGNSWQGQTQLAAASTANPHLKATMPSATWMDAYGTSVVTTPRVPAQRRALSRRGSGASGPADTGQSSLFSTALSVHCRFKAQRRADGACHAWHSRVPPPDGCASGGAS